MAPDSSEILDSIEERGADNRSRLQLFLQRYRREGRAYLYFAAHAAVPALFTADMLYKIRLNFSKNEAGQGVNVPYIAVSDLLQSSICKPVGTRIFALYTPIRRALRRWLSQQPELGEKRRKDIAQFALHYLEACPDQIRLPGLREALRWDAQTITDTAYAGRALLEAVSRSLRRQEPSHAVQKMVEAAEGNLPAHTRSTSLDSGLSRMAFAVKLFRGSQAYRSGHIDEAMQFFEEIHPQLKQQEGGEAFRIPIPEEILRRLELRPERERGDKQKDIYYYAFSLYVVLDDGVDATQAAWRLGVKMEQPDGGMPWAELDLQQEIAGEIRNIHFNVFFIHFTDPTPRILDQLLLSRQGIYLLAVQAKTPEELDAHISPMIWRITRPAPPLFHLWRVDGNWGGAFDSLKDTLHDQYPQLGALISYEEEPLPKVLAQLDKASIETGRYRELSWVTWRECRPEPGALRAIKEIDDRMQAAGGVVLAEELLEKLTAAGEIFYEDKTAGEPFLVAHKPFFINMLFEGAGRVEKIAPEGVCRLEAFISMIDKGMLPEWVETLLGALEKYGLLFRKTGDQQIIIIPHLLPKRAPEFDVNLHETAYQQTTLRFSGAHPAELFNRFTALLGASGANLRSYTRLGLVWETERETVRILERSGLAWQVMQVRKAEKADYDKLEELYRLLDEILTGYYQVSVSPTKPLQIPAYATPKMVNVSGGTFTMGWQNKERDGEGDDDEKPAHEVKLNSFSIGKHQVTFEAYDAFCEATGRDKPKDAGWGRGRSPVIYVDWYDAVEYCNWLSEIWGLEQVYEIDKNKKDPNNKSEYDDKKWMVTINENANGYRLPTEAEWEYAARGGQKSEGYLYAGSNELDEVGWYSSNSGSKTHPVGEKQPNELGLYDMSGNVYEWCWDWFAGDYYQSSLEDNPGGPGQGSVRVYRGGHWFSIPQYCRAAYRNFWAPASRDDRVGFRLARSLEAAPSYEQR